MKSVWRLFYTSGSACVAILIVVCSAFGSSEGVPSETREWFNNLAERRIDLSEIEKLSKVPGFAAALIKLADQTVAKNRSLPAADRDLEHLYFILYSIEQRSDLNESEQQWVRSLLYGVLGQDQGTLGNVIRDRCLLIAGKYHSPENEEVLIKFLGDRQGPTDKFGYSVIAAGILGECGTNKAVGPLKAYAERFKSPNDPQIEQYTTAIESINSIAARERGVKGVR